MDIQTQVQDKMQEMLADRLMSKRCEMFDEVLAGDIVLAQEIIRLVCTDTSPLGEYLQNRMINSLGPTYKSWCQQLVQDDIAAEDEYAKDAAVEMEIEQRRLGL